MSQTKMTVHSWFENGNWGKTHPMLWLSFKTTKRSWEHEEMLSFARCNTSFNKDKQSRIPKIEVCISNGAITVIRFRFGHGQSPAENFFWTKAASHFTKKWLLTLSIQTNWKDRRKYADNHSCLGLVTSLWNGLFKQFMIELCSDHAIEIKRPKGTFTRHFYVKQKLERVK